MSEKKATVVIVGRPNVGKSTLFNRIVGKREAIVDDQPGVTRDCKFRVAEWAGKRFSLVDTGGIYGSEDDPFTPVVQQRIEMAVEQAAVLMFILDATTGPTTVDHQVMDHVRRLKVPMIGVVNKVDNMQQADIVMAPFYELGLDEIFPVSAIQGTGTGDLLDEVIAYIPEDAQPDFEILLPGIAIIGRPNVGKSTLLNALCGSDRAIVSPVSGTTRDPVDTEVEFEGERFLLIDTAGIRRRGKMSQGLDRYALNRAQKALERCHVALMMIDGSTGLTETDAKVFGLAKDAGKAAVILVNKWDITEKDEHTTGEFAKHIRKEMPFLHYAPIEFISAMTLKRTHRIFPNIKRIAENFKMRVPTGKLNALLEGIINKHPPPVHKGKSPRIYYWTQVETMPPTFVAFVSNAESIHFSYQRYLVNQLYETFGFEGTPIRLFMRTRGKKDKHE